VIDYLGTPRIARQASSRPGWRNLPVEGYREDVRASIKAAAWGIATALFVVLFLVVRH
jgi:uncharacterized membrane protein